ncbi:MAG: non-canonical purine NTP pyrophosphatase [Syntrophobacterales bacterium CG_4_8_14_3_um_filter_49_14]|nr:MAG: non-canonical purine NTP pyrophosphatase [Syntrophobacterales bacterium CG23_combo_of_CG06-09_8_20_14_all_48_27]PJA49428.1 MAG: non-canonical purine NTP pyrophosphatase [Syntrophobacterales bacterium CG_4_9_14_3_um_filter_49_8]PJC77107.1 MAG: non-canonical purine NTP pyrophosphatase [Syntrophobacterales bacterium CG_4_8_14_3_um_filter_49_14]
MIKIVFASKNNGKIKEIKAMLEGLPVVLLSLNDYKDILDIIEDGKTFFENALKKARVVSEFTGEVVLADDSGLEVDCLGGQPGIYSSRYAGENATDENNMRKLLENLRGIPSEKRGASFRCVLVLYQPDGAFESFEGGWRGQIYDKPVGERGFGYDPVFFLPEKGMTVAQLPPEVKNTISHRAQAFHKLKKSFKKHVLSEVEGTGRSAAW